jgi:hypothetical protein
MKCTHWWSVIDGSSTAQALITLRSLDSKPETCVVSVHAQEVPQHFLLYRPCLSSHHNSQTLYTCQAEYSTAVLIGNREVS